MKKNNLHTTIDIDLLHCWIAILELDGTIINCNEIIKKQLNNSIEQGTNIATVITKFDQKIFKNIIEKGKWQGVVQIDHTINSSIYIDFTCCLKHNENENEDDYIICTGYNITPYYQAKKEQQFTDRIAELNFNRLHKTLVKLEKAKSESDSAAMLKQEFLANVSHEIRTPLNSIIGFAELLAKTQLTEQQKKYLEAVQISGRNLLNIVTDVLDFSKLESGKLTIENNVVNIKSVIADVKKIFDIKINEKAVQFNYFIDPILPEKIIIDGTHLTQILINLLSNAFKFTPTGSISVVIGKYKNQLHIQVNDTGIGIDANKVSTIFDSFTQVSSDYKFKQGGSGLGLSIVKKLVELNNGTISVKSILGQGTSFDLKLPLISAENMSEVEDIATTPFSTQDIENKKILVAEDQHFNQLLIKHLLEPYNCEVDIANDGVEVLEMIHKKVYDAILMDIQMPRKNGIETTKAIRQDMHITTPIICVTANIFTEENESCIQAGATAILLKPFTSEEFYSKLGQSIANAQNTNNYNLHYLWQMANGNNDFVKKILLLFKEQLPIQMEELKEAIRINNYEMIKQAAHKMRNATANLQMYKTERNLEELEKNNQLSDSETLAVVKNIENDYQTVWNVLNQLLKEDFN